MKSTDERIERALNRLLSITGRSVLQSMFKDILKDEIETFRNDLLMQLNGKGNVNDVIEAVCKQYNIKVDDLMKYTRVQVIVEPRQVCSWFIYKKVFTNSLSLDDIGQIFGGYDHATILHGIKKIDNLLGVDKSFRHDVIAIYNILGYRAEWTGTKFRLFDKRKETAKRLQKRSVETVGSTV